MEHRIFTSRHYEEGGNAERVEIRTASRASYNAAVKEIKKEQRRRRASGGEALEFRIILQEG